MRAHGIAVTHGGAAKFIAHPGIQVAEGQHHRVLPDAAHDVADADSRAGVAEVRDGDAARTEQIVSGRASEGIAHARIRKQIRRAQQEAALIYGGQSVAGGITGGGEICEIARERISRAGITGQHPAAHVVHGEVRGRHGRGRVFVERNPVRHRGGDG